MSITYRYRCSVEGELVYETRPIGDAAPTVCVNDNGALVAGSLTILERPVDVSDLVVRDTMDFTNAVVTNLQHSSLVGAGTHTHAQLDSHVDDATIHRQINDAGTGATDLWSASQITTQLATKASAIHTHLASDVTDFNSAADARITAQKAQANGLATLGADSKIPASQLPAIAITSVHVVADIAARDALTVQEGDVVKVLDNGSGSLQTYIYDGSVWIDIQETSDVVSVNGYTGTVTLTSSDVAEGTNKYYTEARVSANTDVAANSAHRVNTANPHGVTLDQVTSASNKGDLLGHNGVIHVVQAVGSNGQVLEADSNQGTGLRWVNNKKFIVSSRAGAKTISSEWTRMDNFIYPGSSIAAAKVSRILINAEADTGITYKLRVYDVTNGNEVGTLTGQTNTTPQILSLGALTNVPNSDALFEVHAARTSGLITSGVNYYSVMLEYQ
jgi:hypothetical protein